MNSLASSSNNIVITSNDIKVFCSPKAYKQQLLSLIKLAKFRIYITVLYLQDDSAGREILHALYQAKQNNPQLDVKVFVDFHRAQRGLIGEKSSLGNRALYLALAREYTHNIEIYGVAVKQKEVFGVLHLKGFVFDNTLFYTGASINDIYLYQDQRYRLDRYYQITSSELTDTFCEYLERVFIQSNLAPSLNIDFIPSQAQQKKKISRLKSLLNRALYTVNDKEKDSQIVDAPDNIIVQPLVGCGRRKNKLNSAIRQLVQKSEVSILLFTPYFNLPKVLTRDVVKALKRGVKISIVIGDKTANDFYEPDENKFSTINGIPYLYEMLLVRFVKRWQRFIDNGQLDIRLWKDQDNSFHLKGMVVDERFHLLTGSNLNPRAWSLDLENGLLLDDISGSLMSSVNLELAEIHKYTQIITHFKQIESFNDYPEKPKKLLKKLRITQIDRLLKWLL